MGEIKVSTAHLAAGGKFQRVPTLIILLFWTLQFVSLSITRLAMGEADTRNFILPRLLACCVGVVLSAVILSLHERQAGRLLSARALRAFALAVIASGIHAAANYAIFEMVMPKENESRATIASYVSAVEFWFWCYLAISSLLLALVYSRELADRERDFAELERLAQAAQLRALRYQLNPHFMFNTLNSIAALICTGENDTAERMVEGLGEFLERSLAIDPLEDHRLDDEIELQNLYLGIEKLRFPDRFSFVVDIDRRTAGALIPSLILQPLTENVVKHCVSVSSGKVELVISSRIDDERLLIEVINSPPGGDRRSAHGTSLGLKNVAERLRARFGDAHQFQAKKLPDGSFQVRMELPVSFGVGR